MMNVKRLSSRTLLRFYALAFCAALALFSPLLERAVTVSAIAPSQGDPSVAGAWSGPFDWGLVVIHSHVLPNGKVLFWTRDKTAQGGDVLGSTQARVWDPATGIFTLVPNPTTNLFCSGHSFLPDGRLLVSGGHKQFDGHGEPHTNIFDFNTNTWTRGQDMNAGRWYPTTCPLGSGEVLTVSGAYWDGTLNPDGSHHLVNNTLPQVWQPSTGSWRSLTTAAEIGQDLYPWMLLAPTGQVFNSGPTQTSRYLKTSGTGAWSFVANSNFGFRDYGSSVMYDDGRVLIVGGGTPTNSAEVINLNQSSVVSQTITPNTPTPTWRFVNGMANARRQMNLTILADGKVLATGGTSSGGFSNATGSVFAAEMWNSDTETWSTMASMQTRRLYHSTAVLLPDGRVLSAGGGHPASDGGDFNHTDVEVYSPPYLFKGARPVITSAPTVVNHGEQFFVGTPDAAGISKVTMVRLSSVTHAFNQDQRINYLSFQKTSSGLNVTASGGSHLCPPGYYMLFIINSNGAPSVAQIIQVTVPAGTKNSIDDQQYFVRMQYQDFFDRSPDRGGLDFWTGTITQCGNNSACKGGKRGNVSRAFWESGEFQTPLRNSNDPLFFPTPPNGLPYNTNEFVKKCYRIYLRREGDSSGVNFWTNGLNTCIANNPGNPSGCYDNTINAFISSGDYRNRFNKP
jgi:hypothetical protein